MLQRTIKCDVSIPRGRSHINNLVKGRLVKKSLLKSELNGDNMYSIGKCEGDENFKVSVLRQITFKEE